MKIRVLYRARTMSGLPAKLAPVAESGFQKRSEKLREYALGACYGCAVTATAAAPIKLALCRRNRTLLGAKRECFMTSFQVWHRCRYKRHVSAQFLGDETVAMFELTLQSDLVKVVEERSIGTGCCGSRGISLSDPKRVNACIPGLPRVPSETPPPQALGVRSALAVNMERRASLSRLFPCPYLSPWGSP